jgi:hypothetical protein
MEQTELQKQVNRFEIGLSKLNSLMKGNLSPIKKVDNTTVNSIVEELLKEEQEQLRVTLKDKLKSLLSNKIKLDKEIKIKQEEFDKIISEKYKEFNREIENVFGMVDNITEIEKRYNETLTEVVKQ